MSFALTTGQILDQSKTVTRRLGWDRLTPGTFLWAIEKGQGLKKGEKVKRLAIIEVVDVRREPLEAIDEADVIREGFPHMTPSSFVAFFCDSHKVIETPANPAFWEKAKYRRCRPSDEVTRIEFRYPDIKDGTA
jgi:hypothetical protein